MTVNRELTCERLGPDGRGIAVVDGVEIAAADWLPGEVADLEIEHASPHRPIAWARVLERRGPPSPDRVAPACPGFGACGGCRLQHASAAAQLGLKRGRLVDALAAAGLAGVEVAAVTPSPAALGYRNKGKYVFGRGDDGAVVVGAYRPRSHRVTNTLGCRVVEPAIDRAAVALAAVVEASGISIHDEQTRSGALRYAIVRAGVDGAVVVALITTSSAGRAAIEAIAGSLIGAGIGGVAWAINDRRDGALIDSAAGAIAGDVEVLERCAGVELRLPVDAFAQINRDAAAALTARLVERLALPAGAAVLDAYAGAGAIAIALAAAGAAVTAIEIASAAVDAGRRAIDAAGLAVDLRSGDAAAALGARFDAAVVNPPRKGLAADARAALIASGTPRIAYVSCGPESLARDLAALAAAGYRVDRVEPFDLMPGTPEIETLTLCFKARTRGRRRRSRGRGAGRRSSSPR